MKVNNNAQSTSFGMKLIPPKRIHLSETARYVLYQVNKELAPIRGGNIKFNILDYSLSQGGDLPDLVGKVGDKTIVHKCEGFNFTKKDLMAFVAKFKDARGRVGRLLDKFSPKSNTPRLSDYGLQSRSEEEFANMVAYQESFYPNKAV